MIQEAYCSFEIAKLLKEKGFDEPCYRWYDAKGDVCAKFINPDIPLDYSSREYYLCPSQSMTMKWLREVHHIAINIGWGEIFEDQYKWWSIVLNMDNGNILYEVNYHVSYEDAVEAALKYTLENLI